MAEQANFKRINFFEGFFTTDEDWNSAEAYHLEKRRLHNRVLHTPGVVPVESGGLKVQARGRGDLSFEVAPGYGIDGRGNEMVLRDPAVKAFRSWILGEAAAPLAGIEHPSRQTAPTAGSKKTSRAKRR